MKANLVIGELYNIKRDNKSINYPDVEECLFLGYLPVLKSKDVIDLDNRQMIFLIPRKSFLNENEIANEVMELDSIKENDAELIDYIDSKNINFDDKTFTVIQPLANLDYSLDKTYNVQTKSFYESVEALFEDKNIEKFENEIKAVSDEELTIITNVINRAKRNFKETFIVNVMNVCALEKDLRNDNKTINNDIKFRKQLNNLREDFKLKKTNDINDFINGLITNETHFSFSKDDRVYKMSGFREGIKLYFEDVQDFKGTTFNMHLDEFKKYVYASELDNSLIILDKNIELKLPKNYSVYRHNSFGQPTYFWNDVYGRYFEDVKKATLFTKDDAELKRKVLLDEAIEIYQKNGIGYKEIHTGDLFKKGYLKFENMENKKFKTVEELLFSGEIQKMDHIAPILFGETNLQFTNCKLVDHSNGDEIFVVKKIDTANGLHFLRSHYEADCDGAYTNVYFTNIESLDNFDIKFQYIDIKAINDLAHNYNAEYDYDQRLDMEMEETYVDNHNDLSFDMFFRQLCIAQSIKNDFIPNVKMALENNLKLKSIDPNDLTSVNKMAISSEFTNVVALLVEIKNANFKPKINMEQEQKEKKHPQNYQYVRGFVSNLKTLENGMVSFSVGYPKEVKNEEEPEWVNIRVMAKGKGAENTKGISDGDLVECSGQSEFSSYKDKNTDKDQYTNTLWLGKVTKHERDAVKSENFPGFEQKPNNVILLKGEFKDKPFSKVLKNETKHTSVILDNIVKFIKPDETWGEKRSDVKLDAFGKSSEAMSGVNMLKGSSVEISGVVEPKTYEDKDGDKRYTVSVNVINVELQKEKVKEATQGR